MNLSIPPTENRTTTYSFKTSMMWEPIVRNDSNEADEEPFLPSKVRPQRRESSYSRHRGRFFSDKTAVIQVAILVLNVVLASILFFSIQPPKSCPETHVFAKDAIRYTQKEFLPYYESPWTGYPSPELEVSWARLLEDASFRLSDDELAQMNATSIELQESSGRLAWLEVSHQIHCVQYLRKVIYRNHYYPKLTDEDWAEAIQPHFEHCLNDLLQNVMCRGDTTLKFFEWEPNHKKPVIMPNYMTPRTCVDLDYLKSSLKDRVVPYDEMMRLQNPLLQ